MDTEHGWLTDGATCAAEMFPPCGECDETAECAYCGAEHNEDYPWRYDLDNARVCHKPDCQIRALESDRHELGKALQMLTDARAGHILGYGKVDVRKHAEELVKRWRAQT